MSIRTATINARQTEAGRWLAARRERLVQAPQLLRALVRGDEIWLVVLAAFIGLAAGLLDSFITVVTQGMHRVLFDLPAGQRLSGAVSLDPVRALAFPVLGGLLMGATLWWQAHRKARRAIDPIEANALFGGRLSLNDSLIVMGQTMLSNGVGASVGLEAAYTQIGGAVASRLGRSFRLRRADLRVLVGCGAAGAIAGAFNAPLTGAFYAYELVIGTYALGTLAPVVVAALTATFVVNALDASPGTLELLVPSRIETVDYIAVVALGIICALVGIAIMRGVTLTEAAFRRSRVPVWLRPGIGGLVVGGLALFSPSVMSSGHAALSAGLDAPYTLSHIALLIAGKSLASAVSIGSGFRGGLFFASLFLGGMTGKLFAGGLAILAPLHALPPVVCGLVGMSAMAVAIISGPLTMTFLALETTGSLPMTAAVLAACVVSSLTVRRTFGYSFATWRFHLRGESIRSAVDIGWVRNLTVGKMMRREVRTVRADLTMAQFSRENPLGTNSRVIAVDAADRYAGIVQVAEAYADGMDKGRVADILHDARAFLLPQMTIKEAVTLFETAESDALAVLDGPETRLVIGLLTEQHALRRYAEELDRQRRDLSGE